MFSNSVTQVFLLSGVALATLPSNSIAQEATQQNASNSRGSYSNLYKDYEPQNNVETQYETNADLRQNSLAEVDNFAQSQTNRALPTLRNKNLFIDLAPEIAMVNGEMEMPLNASVTLVYDENTERLELSSKHQLDVSVSNTFSSFNFDQFSSLGNVKYKISQTLSGLLNYNVDATPLTNNDFDGNAKLAADYYDINTNIQTGLALKSGHFLANALAGYQGHLYDDIKFNNGNVLTAQIRNNSTYSASGALGYEFSPKSNIMLGYDYSKTDYEINDYNGQNRDFDLHNLYAELNYAPSEKLSAQLRGGVQQINSKTTLNAERQYTAAANLEYKATERIVLALSALREISQSANNQSDLAKAQLQLAHEIGLDLSYRLGETTFAQLGGNYRMEDNLSDKTRKGTQYGFYTKLMHYLNSQYALSAQYQYNVNYDRINSVKTNATDEHRVLMGIRYALLPVFSGTEE